MASITIDGTEYETDALSAEARSQLASLQVCDQKLKQLQIEVAIVQTARQAYAAALKQEIEK